MSKVARARRAVLLGIRQKMSTLPGATSACNRCGIEELTHKPNDPGFRCDKCTATLASR